MPHPPHYNPDSALHVLVLPSFYADPERPILGSFFKEQALALQNAGAKVGVVYYEGRRLQALSPRALKKNHFQNQWHQENGLATLRQHGWNPLSQTTRGALLWAKLTARLADRYIREHGLPDVIHAHNSVWAGHAASLIAKKHGIPFVVTEHSSLFPSNTVPPSAALYVKETFRQAAAVVAVSGALKQSMQPFLDGRPVEIVPNVVNIDYFHPPTQEPKKTPRVFLCVARLVEVKGLDVLLRAWAHSFKGCSHVELRIVGEGPLRAELLALTGELGIENNVRFLGRLDSEGVRQELWKAHVLVSASRIETFGVVVIEALATGLPVIATLCGGPQEIVTPQVGLLVKTENEMELADALKTMHEKTFCTRDMARTHVVQNYSAPVIADKLMHIFRDCIGTT